MSQNKVWENPVMKRTSWKTALVCGLALSLSSLGLFGRGIAADPPATGKGGDKPKAAGAAEVKDKVPAAGGQKPGGASAPHSGGGAVRVPAAAGAPQPAGSGQPPAQNRTPSFTQPSIGKQPGVVVPPPVAVPLPAGPVTQRPGINQTRIGNQPFVGNTVNYNNRDFNVGHSSYQPAYYRHSGYHGYWNGNRGYGDGSGVVYGTRPRVSVNIGGFGLNIGSSRGSVIATNYGNGGGYGYRPLGWGMGGWGLGSLYYNSGYLGYSNPYYVSVGSTGYNYSQPIPVSYNSAMVVADYDPNSAAGVLNNADAAFRQNDYDAALDIINKGVAQYPDDAVLHEFRSLVLFARHDYQQSAATIHSVLAVGPGWDWTTLSSMYSSAAIYTEQLRALEAFTKTNPQDAASRFLLAYHYMSCGHPDSAARHLQQVVKLMPNDRVAADVLKMVSAPQAGQPGDSARQPIPEPPQDPVRPAVDPATLVGAWKAARPDGSKFDLTLTNDGKFTWSFAQKNQPAQGFGGKYSVDGNVLALERKDGGSLIAEITPGGEAKFNFKLLGAPGDDPGLDFSR